MICLDLLRVADGEGEAPSDRNRTSNHLGKGEGFSRSEEVKGRKNNNPLESVAHRSGYWSQRSKHLILHLIVEVEGHPGEERVEEESLLVRESIERIR